MKARFAELLNLLAGAGAAIFLVLSTTNGAFAALFNGISSDLGLSASTTTAVRSIPSYVSREISSITGSGSGATATETALTSTVSQNWAGYVATKGNYTAMTGTWTVPSVSGSIEGSADAAWIGIGGSGTSDLIQIGTENVVSGGQVVTEAFYEELPDYAQNIDTITLSPGDTVNASITETSTDSWNLTIDDVTNGQTFSTNVDYTSSNSSAEWIEEAPSSTTDIMPLDSFGSISFSGATVTQGGATESVTTSGATAITMQNSAGLALTDVSTVTDGGDGFTVTRTSADSSSYSTTSRREPGGVGRFRRF